MYRALFPLLLIFLFPHTLLGQHTDEAQKFNPKASHYLWPTEASSHLTSTFAETRSQHFHAALDIKTWGRRGYEVYATRDGVVDRIAISPTGYGKVVYLKHKDGSYSVYAHLLSFNKRLQQFADSIRFEQNFAFEIERFLSWKNIKVKQGEVIGYSGASGIGPPHLHFELRTPSHKPFNPLLTNLKVKDTIAPEFSGIAIEPLTPTSTAEGKNAIYTRNSWKQNGSYEAGTINVTGAVGLAVDVFDQSNGVHNAYAVYELAMFVDGNKRFHSKVDSFSYNETGQMFLDRIYPILKTRDTGYQRLYIADGNTLPFYNRTLTNNGRLNLKRGQHNITIEATDYFGNSSSLSFTLEVEEENKQELKPATVNRPIPKRSTSMEDWYWNNNWITIPREQFHNLTLAADSSDLIYHQNGIAVDLQSRIDFFFNIPELGPINFHRITPSSGSRVFSIGDASYASFPANAFYDTVSIGMTTTHFSGDSVKVDVLPYNAYPLRNNFTFHIERAASLKDTSKLAFYKRDKFDEDEKWELIPTTFTGRYIIGKAETPGSFITMRDVIPPEITNPRVLQRPDQQWVLYIDITDNLSGIAYRKSKISVNGVQGIAEYEPEDDRLVYYHPDFAPSDSMSIEVIAYDKMGNRAVGSFQMNGQ